MRAAVVGSGIAGLTTAWCLRDAHEVVLFEAAARLGGHTCTVQVEEDMPPVDMGFIVYNERNYPGFTHLLSRWGLEGVDSDMGFGVRDEARGIEYSGAGLPGLFAQPRNLLRPGFVGMVRDILRFFREAPRALQAPDDLTLGTWLEREGYGRAFVDWHILPMGAALWSAPTRLVEAFPVKTFVRFFANHGFLERGPRAPWRTLPGGARTYVERVAADLGARIRRSTPVLRIHRTPQGVEVTTPDGTEVFDAIVLATHSDQALALLGDPTTAERQILGAIPWQRNEAVLHNDLGVLPRARRARASWNVYRGAEAGADHPVGITYWMNRLQPLADPRPWLVTLNRTADIDPDRIVHRETFHHPVFTVEGLAAQRQWDAVNGAHRTWYAGAWWGHGFHEDGVQSAFRVVRAFGVDPEAIR